MSQTSYLIGMDCGTTNIKAVALGSDGKVAAKASRRSHFIAAGADGHEQSPDAWWQSVCEIFQEITKTMGPEEAGAIKGVCISSHTVSLVPVAEDGSPVRNGITYQDQRSRTQLQEIVEKVGRDQYVDIVGAQPSAAFLPGKLLWYKQQEPEHFAKTRWILQANGYINLKLTDVVSVDADQGLRTQCMDRRTGAWSKVIGDAIGVDLDALMPPASPVDAVIGTVTAAAAAATGLPEGTPVLAGCCDATAAMYSAGLGQLGEVVESSGTTSLVFAGSKTPSAPDAAVTSRPCAIAGIPYVYDAPIQTSGAAIQWYIDRFAAEEKEEAAGRNKDVYTWLNEKALTAACGSGGVIFFPYLLGERAPLWNDHARGMFIGMSMSTGKAQVIRSIFEGTAFALRHVISTIKADGVSVDCLKICGGGAKSRTWAMIKASMLNVPVLLLDENGGDVPVGDAFMAGIRLGIFGSLSEAAEKTLKIKEEILPDPEWVKVYDQMFPLYVDMYRQLDGDLKKLVEISEGLG